MDGKAIIYTHGMLDQSNAKTAHGLVRGSARYQIMAVVDQRLAGKDAGEVVEGTHKDIPIYGSLSDYLSSAVPDANYLIIGIATKGGYLPKEMKVVIKEAIMAGLSIVNGLHEFLQDDAEMVALAASNQVELIDIRKPRPKGELKFWNGEIHQVTCPKIAVMGTDCALGKRTTARFLTEAAREAGLKAEMIYTGQTGWLQGSPYGFIFDSTYNDFVSGELEQAMVTCFKEAQPDMIFIEGQAALQNPSGPCGAEFLVSGRTEGVVLQHSPTRVYYGDIEAFGKIKPLADDLELIKRYGSQVIALTLNTQGLNLDEAFAYKQEYEERYQLPVVLPIEEGVAAIIPLVQQLSVNTL